MSEVEERAAMDVEETSNDTNPFEPYKFPFDEATCAAIARRRAQLSDQLFFDIILESSDVSETEQLYPPRDLLAFQRLRDSYTAATTDTLRKNCLTYYLLKWFNEDGAKQYAEIQCIPSHFISLTDAYFYFDQGDTKKAVYYLCDLRIPPNNSSKVLYTLSLAGDNSDILTYIRSANPVLTEQWELDLHVVALTRSSLSSAWQYQRSFAEGEVRKQLLRKIVETCLLPKPSPRLLEHLLAFPYNPFEQSVLHSLALRPPPTISPPPPSSSPALTLLHDLVVTRLIAMGQYIMAAQLEKQFPSPAPGDNAAREAAIRRREVINEALDGSGMKGIVNGVVDVEMELEGDRTPDSDKGKETPRKSRPIRPQFIPTTSTTPARSHPVPSTFNSTNASTSTPSLITTSSTSQPQPQPSSRLDHPTVLPPTPQTISALSSTPRFGTPPRSSAAAPSYIRAQGAPSPASPTSMRSMSIQKTKNAFFEPVERRQSLFASAHGSTSGSKSGSGYRARSSLSQVINHSYGSDEDRQNTPVPMDEDDMDRFVINGSRREYSLDAITPGDASGAKENGQQKEQLASEPEGFRLRKEKESVPTLGTGPRRRGVKRAASSQLQPPGAFPRERTSERESGPQEDDESEPLDQYHPLPRFSTSQRATRSLKDKENPSQHSSQGSPPLSPTNIPGSFRTQTENSKGSEGQPDQEGDAEERDFITSLPRPLLGATVGKGRRKRISRAGSVDSDLSEASVAPRRSSRLSAVGSDAESAVGDRKTRGGNISGRQAVKNKNKGKGRA